MISIYFLGIITDIYSIGIFLLNNWTDIISDMKFGGLNYFHLASAFISFYNLYNCRSSKNTTGHETGPTQTTFLVKRTTMLVNLWRSMLTVLVVNLVNCWIYSLGAEGQKVSRLASSFFWMISSDFTKKSCVWGRTTGTGGERHACP